MAQIGCENPFFRGDHIVLTTSPGGRLARSTSLLVVALVVWGSHNVSAVSIDMVWVGNPGNTNDTTGYGSVGYNYRIGKYDVTIGQYADFLNAVDGPGTNPYGLYKSAMGSVGNVKGIQLNGTAPSGSKYSVLGSPNRPITYVSWFDAARFANWMVNGQGAGGTETGAYTLSGMTSGSTPTVNPGASFYIPMENEWYKAAYYSPTLSGSGGYYKYATQSNTAPGNEIGNKPNQANWRSLGRFSTTQSTVYEPDQNYLTDVGSYTRSSSFYGTYDQSGNVSQWTSTTSGTGVLRGGYWGDDIGSAISSSKRTRTTSSGTSLYGFRLAGPASDPFIPGPSEPAPITITINVPVGPRLLQSSDSVHPVISGTQPVFKTGVGTYVVTNANTLTGVTTVLEGTLEIANAAALSYSKVVPLSGGTLTLSPDLQTGAKELAPAVKELGVNYGGLIDVGSGYLTVTGSLSTTDLVNAIRIGRGEDGSWSGKSGITSSVVADEVAQGVSRSIGWLQNGDNSITFGYAAPGDLTLDGIVDIMDITAFIAAGRYDSGVAASWGEGDMDYSGFVDFDDVFAIVAAGLIGQDPYRSSLSNSVVASASPAGNAMTPVSVPEPAGWVLAEMAIAGLFLLRRRIGR